MAVDAHIKIDGIKGESKTQGYVDQIDVLSWSWGASQTGSFAFGGGGGAGKVSMQDLHFIKRYDKASPMLFLAAARGNHIKDAVLTLKKAGGNAVVEYLNIKLEDLLISSVQWSGSDNNEFPTETVAINFAKISITYVEQDNKGTKGAPTKASFDLTKNKSF